MASNSILAEVTFKDSITNRQKMANKQNPTTRSGVT